MAEFGDPRLPKRFWEKVSQADSGCWLWTAGCTGNGYPAFCVNGKNRPAHRHCYKTLVGDVDDKLVIDHLCRTPKCVRPEHLEAVTEQVNLLRGVSGAADRAARTHCPQGHAYSEENTRVYRGMRNCRQCARDSVDRRRAAGYFREYEKRRKPRNRKKGI